MRKVALLTFQTLDGVMQAPKLSEEDLSGDFQHGGWAAPYWEDVMEQVGREAMAEPYDLLLGRSTYDVFAANHTDSGKGNSAAEMLTKAKKYVVTSGNEKLEWENSEKITGDIVAQINKLKQQEGSLIQVHGSWQLIQTLLKHKLVDELRLWTFPVVVGSGKRLFDVGIRPGNFKLIKLEANRSGALLSFYEPE